VPRLGHGLVRSTALVVSTLIIAACGWHGISFSPARGADGEANGANAPQQTEAVPASPTPTAGRPTAPPSNIIQWQTNPIKRTSTGARVFSGTVTNTDPRWSITNVRFELKLLDGNGELKDTLFATLQDLNPGDRGDYTLAVPSTLAFELSNLRLTWDWVLR
jgi:hypothetical protein